MAVEARDGCARHVDQAGAHQLLDQGERLVEPPAAPVALDRGELVEVRAIQLLAAHVGRHLVHRLEPRGEEPLEVLLGVGAQVQAASGGAGRPQLVDLAALGLGVQERRLHLEEAALLEEAADEGDQARALLHRGEPGGLDQARRLGQRHLGPRRRSEGRGVDQLELPVDQPFVRAPTRHANPGAAGRARAGSGEDHLGESIALDDGERLAVTGADDPRHDRDGRVASRGGARRRASGHPSTFPASRGPSSPCQSSTVGATSRMWAARSRAGVAPGGAHT